MPTTRKAPVGTVYLLKRAELAVRSCAEVTLAPFGLTPAQFLALFHIKHSTGVSSAELARATGIRPQSVVDLIGPLEREGLIKRREDPEHRRILRIELTAAGERLVARGVVAAARLERELLSDLSATELAGLHAGLGKLLANAEKHDAHPNVRRSASVSRPASVSAKRKSNARPRKR